MVARTTADAREGQGRWVRFALAALLGFAALAHAALTPAHMAESPLFGLGFLAAGASQLGLASLVLLRPKRVVYIAVIASTAVLIGLYVTNVVVGLPLHGAASHHEVAASDAHEHAAEAIDHHGETSSQPGGSDAHAVDAATRVTPEHVDGVGLATQAAQLAAVGLALALLRRSAPSPRGQSPA